ncbi:hypothetical protein J6590_003586 [Homalodisca vitripennis]|nr:hypothetical protein J6590_003586 [Homalodisca vitripennis]
MICSRKLPAPCLVNITDELDLTASAIVATLSALVSLVSGAQLVTCHSLVYLPSFNLNALLHAYATLTMPHLCLVNITDELDLTASAIVAALSALVSLVSGAQLVTCHSLVYLPSSNLNSLLHVYATLTMPHLCLVNITDELDLTYQF